MHIKHIYFIFVINKNRKGNIMKKQQTIFTGVKNESWDISPSTMFYDYIYLSALKKREKLCEELMQFDTFTDIEFNPQKSINCQARTVAIFVTLNKYGLFDKFISDKELFKSIYLEKPHSEGIQTSLF